MSYLIVYVDGYYEESLTIKGTKSLEKYTDSRIMTIHKNATRIYKVYEDNRAVVMKGEGK